MKWRSQVTLLFLSLTWFLTSCVSDEGSICREGKRLHDAETRHNSQGEVVGFNVWSDNWDKQSAGRRTEFIPGLRTSLIYTLPDGSPIPEDTWVQVEGGKAATTEVSVQVYQNGYIADTNETGLSPILFMCYEEGISNKDSEVVYALQVNEAKIVWINPEKR